ncbi:MAG: ChaN family lipoprotein [Pyrinomonadaceae bacterium]
MAQTLEGKYTVFRGDGTPASLDEIIEIAGNNDAVFLGEYHDDSVGHALEFEIFKRIVDKYSANRNVKLSMEMFERDVQLVVNEYLANLITEKKFLDDSRPWGNYKTDYRPLVELAKEKNLPVIAANSPRRYVNMVSRMGRASLNKLSKTAKSYLPPLPYRKASPAYEAKFRALMSGAPEAAAGMANILDSQSLWDAGMAYSVASNLKKHSLIVNLNGGFHTENRLGTIEHFLAYKPKAKALVVTMRYEKDFKDFNDKYKNAGDYVILTDASQPRSKR